MPQGGHSSLIGFPAPLALPKQPPSWVACPALPVTLHGGASLGVSLVGANPVCCVLPPLDMPAAYNTVRYAYTYMIALASLPMHTLHNIIIITTRQPPVLLLRWSSRHIPSLTTWKIVFDSWSINRLTNQTPSHIQVRLGKYMLLSTLYIRTSRHAPAHASMYIYNYTYITYLHASMVKNYYAASRQKWQMQLRM